MADLSQSGELNQPILNLTPEEKRVFQYLFQQADTEKLGVITGEIAVKFFERTKLAPAVLGEIWQIADTENRGLLTMAGFCQVLRLIGHYQAGRDPTPELAFRPAPLPKFEGLTPPSAPPAAPGFSPQPTGAIQPQVSGNGPIRVPPLVPAKAAEYAGLFEKSGAVNGILSGENAKEIFEKARLPNEVLGRIWNLSDTEQRGALNVTEFIIAMHLLASYRTGQMKALPNTLPPGLYEAASRRGGLPPPPGRPDQSMSIPRQFSGQQSAPRQPSPLGRQPFGAPPQPVQPTGSDWLISPQEKASYDNLFKGVDTMGRGYITGDQAVRFFSDSGLPEDVLAAIWDLADINSEGQLSKDEFAVAMYLIRQQRKGDQLPATLPPNLIPPSLRTAANQAAPAPLPQVAPPPPPPPAPKSAADDLFGLDAFSAPAPAPQQPQSTGGSATFSKPFESDPFGSKAASPTSPHPFQPQPRNPASTFKPFMPSSSFGQTLTAHSTGQSGVSGAPQHSTPSVMDDLLGGEADPEINKKLTQDSTDLANMSNQMTTLRNQMQEVQNKKTATESDLNSVNTQKRDLELRLSQFKTQYDQEVKAVKALEDRLASSRNETRKLQQDLAMIEGSYQDLQNQHRQVGSQLEADQRENNSLKERIRQLNAEIAQLRPQLDKMRNDARQQKGMVAINKKQLATNESERDKIKNEMNDLSRPQDEASRGSPVQTSGVASPAASTTSQSTNPFFRKSPQPAENTMSPSGFAREGPHKDFDSVFGSFGTPQSSAPPVSFRPENPSLGPSFSAPSGQSVRSSEGPDVPTPSTSPPLSSYQESPRVTDPPAPPESRQFGSAFLPLREGTQRSDSFSSSVRASGNRHGGPHAPGNETPTISQASPAGTPIAEKPTVERTDTNRTETDNFNPALFNRNFSASPVTSVTSDTQRSTAKTEDRKDTFSNFGTQDLPGAFPRDSSTPLQQNKTGESSMSGLNRNNADPFGSTSGDPPRGGKDDFDAAFAGFGPSRQTTGTASNSNAPTGDSNKFNKEFPPIEDLAHDDDSDSNDGRGFDDNFTSASPNQKRTSFGPEQRSQQQQRPGTASSDELYRAPPPTTRLDSNLSGLPSPGAQKSPPTYESTVNTTRSGSNQFPPEFGGLLPARENPTSAGSPDTAQGPERSFNPPGGHGAALFGGPSKSATTSPPPLDTPVSTVPSDQHHTGMSYGNESNKGPSPSSNVAQHGKPAFDNDFDAGFDDLADAKEDDKADDDFMFSSQHREGLDEFNPVFDSPAASKSNTMASQQTPTGKPRGDESFSDFEHLSQTFGGQSQQTQPGSSSQDWDAIFSNLESSQVDKGSHSQQASTDFGKSVFDTLDKEEAAASSSKSQQLSPQMPPLGRAISTGTEHDDPILKKLTGMGYARSDALDALEKFDYDINKAADHLASRGN